MAVTTLVAPRAHERTFPLPHPSLLLVSFSRGLAGLKLRCLSYLPERRRKNETQPCLPLTPRGRSFKQEGISRPTFEAQTLDIYLVIASSGQTNTITAIRKTSITPTRKSVVVIDRRRMPGLLLQ